MGNGMCGAGLADEHQKNWCKLLVPRASGELHANGVTRIFHLRARRRRPPRACEELSIDTLKHSEASTIVKRAARQTSYQRT